MSDKKIIAVIGATGAQGGGLGEEFRSHRSPEVARALNPALQSFDTWLSGNAKRIPLG